MKTGYTHITILLDRTGSMDSVKDETIKGFNVFLKEQKKLPGEATITLIQFDTQNPYEVLYDFQPIKSAPELTADTYVPRASTPLFDAIGRSVVQLGEHLSGMKEEDRPEKVVVVILTDGEENSSREYDGARVRDMVKHQEEKYAWKFVFIGAGIDAFADVHAYGMKTINTMSGAKSAGGIRAMYCSLSANMTNYRAAPPSAARDMAFFNADDQAKQDKLGAINSQPKQ